jgi:phenylacetate-coenzyme A ligase PaaK-like adenylate-forming protein
MGDLMQPWLGAATAWDVYAVSHAAAATWERCREQRLQALLAHAAQHSRVYAAAMTGGAHAVPRLQDWPVVQKQQLMQRFDDWVTDPSLTLPALRAFMSEPGRIGEPFAGRYMVWESSGSSGVPGLFVQDLQAMQAYDALEALRRPVSRALLPWFNPWSEPDRLAFVGATTGHFASVCSIERIRRLQPWLDERVRSFSFLLPLPALIEQLDAFAPTLLATYPSTALMLAEEAAAGRARLRPRQIWTGGETLTPAVRHFVQEAFGATIVNSYGASEFLALACECERGVLHLNNDWAILEPVDSQHRAVAPGRFGVTTLLTNLANHVQPLIRYDLGDRVRFEPQPCPCGSPLPVIEVEGRNDDSLLLRDSNGHGVRLPALALVTVLEDDAGVFDFQLVQCADDCLRLSIATSGDAGRRELRRACAALSRFLRSRGLEGVAVQGRCGTHGVAGRSGKIARIVVAHRPDTRGRSTRAGGSAKMR